MGSGTAYRILLGTGAPGPYSIVGTGVPRVQGPARTQGSGGEVQGWHPGCWHRRLGRFGPRRL